MSAQLSGAVWDALQDPQCLHTPGRCGAFREDLCLFGPSAEGPEAHKMLLGTAEGQLETTLTDLSYLDGL